MPQLIISSEVKCEFPSFVIDIENTELQHLTWNDIFDIIFAKIKIPTKNLYIKTINGKRLSIKNIKNFKFNVDNYRLQYSNSSIKNNDYLFTFGIKI